MATEGSFSGHGRKGVYNICGWAIAFILLTSISVCPYRKDTIEEKEAQKEQAKVSSIRFVEDLIIQKENWNPTNIEVDDKGRLYVSEADFAKIYIFDRSGNEIERREFNQGQAPGDVNFLDPALSRNGNFYIYDKKIRRLTIFDKDWKILDSKVLSGSFLFFQLDSQGHLYGWKYATPKVVRGKVESSRSLAKLSSSGRQIGEIVEYREDVDQIISDVHYLHLYPPYGIAKLDDQDFLYFAISDKYEINILSPEGKPMGIIARMTKPRRLTAEDSESKIAKCERVLARFKNRLEFIIPDRMPAIADFFLLENKYVLVITYENPILGPTLKGDLFANGGNYLSSVEVPKYSRWEDWGGLFKKGAMYKHNHFYTVEEDQDGNFKLKRYKVIWN